MAKIFKGDGTVTDTVTGKITIIKQPSKASTLTSKQPLTPKQQKLYNDFQWLKSQDEIKKHGYGKKIK